MMRHRIVFGLLLSVSLWGQTSLNLTSGASPAEANAETTLVSLTASNFPSGAINPADLVVSLEPVSVGPSANVTPISVASVIGSTRRVSFRVPANFSVLTSPAAYRVRISSAPLNLVSSNFSNLTINPPARLVSAVPNSASAGVSIPVTVNGLYSNFVNGVSSLNAGAGITVSGVTVLNRTTLSATLTIAANAAPGPRSFTVTTGLEVAAGANLFTVNEAPASSISSLAPNSGAQSTTVPIVITGLNTNWNASTTATLNGLTVNITSATPTQLNANVVIPDNAALGARTLTLSTGETLANAFTVTQGVKSITSVAPNSGAQSTTVPIVISGVNTTWNASTTAALNGLTVSITSATPTQLNANVVIPDNAALGARTLTLSTGETLANAFTVTQGVKSITSVAPNSGAQSTTVPVVISGVNTTWNSSTTATLNGLTVNITSATPTQLNANVVIPDNATLGARTLTLSTGETLANAFTVTQGVKSITSVAPNSGAQGSTSNITITGVNTTWAPGLAVSLGAGITVNVNTVSATQITASVTVPNNTPLGARTLTISTGESLPNAFTVTQGPTSITSITPNEGFQSTIVAVSIIGVNTNWNSSTTLNLGPRIVAEITSVSPQQINANLAIQDNAPVGSRNLTTSTGESLSNAFLVKQGSISITSVSPGAGSRGTTLTGVVVTGVNTNFTAATTCSFGAGITVDNLTLIDSNRVSVRLQIENNTPLGTRVVACTTGAETALSPDGAFVVNQGTVTISSISPTTGPQGANNFVVSFTGVNTSFVNGQTSCSLGAGTTTNSTTISSPTSGSVNVNIALAAALGSRTLTCTTGAESVSSASGAFSVISGGTPTISSISPTSTAQGTTAANITITGQFTNFLAGTTTLTIDGAANGLSVSNLQVLSPTSLSFTATTTPIAALGGRTLRVTTGAEVVTTTFSVSPGNASLSSVTPNSGTQGESGLNVTINGSNTHFTAATPSVSFGANITVSNVNVLSDTQLTATLNIAAGAAIGPRGVSVTTGGESASGAALFTVIAATPTITSVSPTSGALGSTLASITITGAFTEWVQGTATVAFEPATGVTVGSVTVNSPTSITLANVQINPIANTGTRTIRVTTGPQQLTTNFSLVSGPATLTSLSPSSGSQGTTVAGVVFTGSNTHFTLATPTVSFNSTGVSATNCSVQNNTQLTCDVVIQNTAPTGLRNVSVTTGGEVASGATFNVILGTPTLLSLDPSSAIQTANNVNVEVNGAFTNFGPTSTVSFSSGTGITVNNVTPVSPTQLIANLSVSPIASLGGRLLTVTTGAEVVTRNFTVNAGGNPQIITISIPQGTQTETLTGQVITAANTHFTLATPTVSFGSGIIVSNITVQSNTQLTCDLTIQAGATVGARTVTVTTGGQTATSAPGIFTVNAGTPKILSLVPSALIQGAVNQNLTVTGEFTDWNASTTAGFLPPAGLSVNSITVNSATSLTVNVSVSPTANTGSRTLRITTGAQNLDTVFTVNPGNATITGITPSTGRQNQVLSNVTITGSNTNFAAGTSSVSFLNCSISPSALTVLSPTSLTVNLSIPAGAPVGPCDVRVITGGEIANGPGLFTVQPGLPVLSSINPITAKQGETLNVSISGQFTNFVNGVTTANFGAGITVNSLTVQSATAATANITVAVAATIGNRDLTVTTNAETVSLTNAFIVQAGAPIILSLTPPQATQGNTINVQINGAFTNFTQGLTTANFGSGITAGAVTVNSPTQATVQIQIETSATIGPRNVTLTTGSEIVTRTGGFTVEQGVPLITVINPNIGTPNQNVNVTITGVFTNFQSGVTTARFGPGISVGGAPENSFGPVTVNSPTSFTAALTISPSAVLGARLVEVQNPNAITVVDGFTVQSSTPTAPTIISFTPESFSTNVALNTKVILTFDQPIDRNTVTPSTFRLRDEQTFTFTLPASVEVDATGRVATLTPNSLLPVSRGIRWFASGGGTEIRNPAGTAMALNTQFFTTGFEAENSGPVLSTLSPSSNSTDVPLNARIMARFDKPIDTNTRRLGFRVQLAGADVPGTYTFDNTRTILTFVPSANLSPNTAYTVLTTADLRSASGLALVNPASTTFTTGTTLLSGSGASPVMNPPNGSTNVPVNTVLQMTFSRVINPITFSTSTVFLRDENTFNSIPGGTLSFSSDLRTVFLSFPQPLNFSTIYRLFFTSGTDLAGNSFNGISSFFTTGTSGLTEAPQVSIVSPANGSTGVPVNARVELSFTQPILAASFSANSLQLSPAAAGNLSLSSDGRTLTFIPSPNLAPSTQYTINLTGLSNFAGIPMAAFTSSFTTAASATSDTTAPTISSRNPDSTATNVATNSPVSVTFSEPISPQALFDVNTLRVFTGSSSYAGVLSLSADGRTLTFAPSAPYAANSAISVRPGCEAAIRDLAGNQLGCTQYSFATANTPDTTPFQVTSMTPADGSTNLGPNATVVLRLNKPANVSTVNSASVNLFRNTNSFNQSPTLSAGGTEITLQLSGAQPGETLEVAASNLIQDLSGNPLVPFVGRLSTAVFPAQGAFSISSIRPANGASGVEPTLARITLIASRPLNASTLAGNVRVSQNGILFAGSVTLSADGQGIVFTAPGPFLPGARVEINVLPGLLDLSGNSITAFASFFNVTPDLTSLAPTVLSVSPNGGNIPNNTVFEATFSKPMDPASFNAANFFIRNDNTFQTVAANPPVFSNGNRTVRITAVAPLTAGVPHRLIITNVRDSNNIAHSSNATASGLVLASADTFPPAIDSIVPGDGISGIGPNASIAIRFSEPINRLTLNANTLSVTGGGYSFSPSLISFSSDSREVFVTPSELFPASTNLTLALNGVQDLAGNALPPFSLQFSTSGSLDLSPATISFFSVSANQTDVPTNSTFSVRFSEPVDPRTVQPIFILREERTFQLVPISPVTFTPDYRNYTFAPQSTLNVGESYRLFVNGAALDFAGNASTSATVPFRTAFTADTAPPTVLSFSPAGGFTGAPTNSRLEILFDRPVRPETVGSVNVRIGGTPISLASRSLADGNRRLILLPNLLLAPSTAHTFSVSEVASTAGSFMAGTTNSTFTTGATFDRIAPSVSSISPGNSTTGVPTNPTIQVQFNEPVIPFSVDTDQVALRNDDNFAILPNGQISVAADQRSATLTFPTALQPFTRYRIFISGGIRDLAGNPLNGISSTFVTGAGSVSTPPQVTGLSPTNGNSAMPVNGRVRVRFDQPVNTANIPANALTTVPAASFAAAIVAGTNNTMVEFTPVPNLASNQLYLATLSGISSTAGAMMAPFNFTFTTTAVNDTAIPTLVSRNPDIGAAGVAVNSTVSITFSEPINPLTLDQNSFRLFTSLTGNFTEYSGTRTISADLRTITFTPNAPFRANSTVSVRPSCESSIRDFAGNAFGCIQYDFTTANTSDATPFEVSSFSPVPGSTDVSLANPILIQFSRPINQSTVNCNTVFLLLNQSLNQCPTVVGPGLISFTTGLSASANYSIVVSSGVQDTNGNPVVPANSNFTTASVASGNAPNVASLIPAGGASVPADASFTVFFNQTMDPATLPGAIRLSQNGQLIPATVTSSPNGIQATITPSSPLSFNAQVILFVERTALSSGGVPLGSAFNTAFSVAANPASGTPPLISASPIISQTNVPLNARVELRYGLPLNPATVTTANFILRDDTTFVNVPATLELLDSGRLIRLTPNANLQPNRSYTWIINTAVQGANGTPIAGSAQNFTTGNTAVSSTPTLLSTSPVNGASGVATNARIRLTLDRPFARPSLTSSALQLTGPGYAFIPAIFDFDTPQDVVITPLRPLPPSTTFTLSLTGLTDVSGNLLPNFTSTFTTGQNPDVTPASIVSFSVASFATNVPVNTVVEARFSEPIDPRSLEVNNRVTLRRNDTFTNIEGTISFSADRLTLFFTPAANLTPSLSHTLTVLTNYLDQNGTLGNGSAINFTTGAATDLTPPAVLLSTPNQNQTGVLTNTRLSLRFSEPIGQTALSGIAVNVGGNPIPLLSRFTSDGQRVVNLIPAATLAPNTLHTISLSGVRDLAGNTLASTNLSFTTGADGNRFSAVLSSTAPSAGQVNVPVSVAPTLTFAASAPAVDIVSAADNLQLLVNATSAVVPTTISVSPDGRTVTLTPTAPLNPNTVYRISYNGNFLTANGVPLTPSGLNSTFTTAP